jgi:hypothetical protein
MIPAHTVGRKDGTFGPAEGPAGELGTGAGSWLPPSAVMILVKDQALIRLH